MFKCPHCGQELPDDSLFCEGCGQDVTNYQTPEPTVQEAVKPQKKGKSLKIFIAGMVAVIVIVALVLGPRLGLYDGHLFGGSQEQEQTDSQSQPSESQKETSNDQTARSNASDSSSTAKTTTITSVVGTWTDADGEQIMFNTDGALLAVKVGNNGAYTACYGGTYEQNKDQIVIRLGVCEKGNTNYKRLFDTSKSVTATLSGNELKIPLILDSTAILKNTSTTVTNIPALTAVFNKLIELDQRKEKFKIEANGTWTSEKNETGYWVCYVGKKDGKDYGSGTLVLYNIMEVEYGSYRLSS